MIFYGRREVTPENEFNLQITNIITKRGRSLTSQPKWKKNLLNKYLTQLMKSSSASGLVIPGNKIPGSGSLRFFLQR